MFLQGPASTGDASFGKLRNAAVDIAVPAQFWAGPRSLRTSAGGNVLAQACSLLHGLLDPGLYHVADRDDSTELAFVHDLVRGGAARQDTAIKAVIAGLSVRVGDPDTP